MQAMRTTLEGSLFQEELNSSSLIHFLKKNSNAQFEYG